MIENRKIFNITASSLEKYLLFKNWKRDYGFKNRNQMVFYLDEETLVIPASEKYKDFYMVLPDVLENLSELYNKPVIDIVKEINSSYHDLLEFRIKSKLSEDGELPLGYASDCIVGLKELILYSACAEQHQEPICLRTTNNAKEILNNFKFAQTDVGSFIINIDIKVVDEENEQLVLQGCEGESSVEHKIVKRIGTAIRQIDEVAQEKVKLDDMLPTAYQLGITANMCDALMKLKPHNDEVAIETKIRYASAISQKINDGEIVEIRSNHFYTMDEIAKRYRNVENAENCIVCGYIKSLDKVAIAPHRYKRMITIISNLDGKDRTVKAELCDEDHRMACDAFRDECEIEIQGLLDRSKKVWEMQLVEEFKIISK